MPAKRGSSRSTSRQAKAGLPGGAGTGPASPADARPACRVGDRVRVRSFDEILATLDADGCLDGMPFMPEMARYCGQGFRIEKSAHKTCDPTGASDMREMPGTVHIGARCDGSDHDGCEARCLLFWKTAWLVPDNPAAQSPGGDGGLREAAVRQLRAATRRFIDGQIRYRCQATEIVRASRAIRAWHINQYTDDIALGNVGWLLLLTRAIAVGSRALLSRVLPAAWRRPRCRQAKPISGNRPAMTASLKPGDLVRVRQAEEILSTLDGSGRHRGLAFEREMLRYCNGEYRVLGHVRKLIDERTGRMVTPKTDCIILEGVVCRGLQNPARLFCPRAPFFYWREDWLERATSKAGAADVGRSATPVFGADIAAPSASPR